MTPNENAEVLRLLRSIDDKLDKLDLLRGEVAGLRGTLDGIVTTIAEEEPEALPPGYLSPNFTLAELTFSNTATANGIDNTPPPAEVANLETLAAVLDQVRAICGDHAVMISSGYRCPELNALVGGASNSAHLYGLAADFTIPDFGDVNTICHTLEPVLGALGVDQLIDESGGGASWVHLGLASAGAAPRCQCLTINAHGTTAGFA